MRLQAKFLSFLTAASLLLAFFLLLAASASAQSHVRIVRLSYLNGQVHVERPGNTEFEQALPNMPVVEGMKLATGSDGVAELEMEDGSTIRIIPETEIELGQLALADSGGTLSSVAISRGTAYVDFRRKHEDTLELSFPGHHISLVRPVRLRAEVAADEADLAVFNGEFDLTGLSSDVRVKKDETITLDLADPAQYDLEKAVDAAPYDDWSNERERFREHYASSITSDLPAENNVPSYGLADLAYYGTSFDYPGYGWVWQPYGIAAGWNPFSSGYWTYYNSTGWVWGSYAPWGWYPYRYGSWLFTPNYGWVWSPQGWRGGVWHPLPPVNGAPAGFLPPARPIRPPSGVSGFVAVGPRPTTTFSGGLHGTVSVPAATNPASGFAESGPHSGVLTTPVPSHVREMRESINTPENQAMRQVMQRQDTYRRQQRLEMQQAAGAAVVPENHVRANPNTLPAQRPAPPAHSSPPPAMHSAPPPPHSSPPPSGGGAAAAHSSGSSHH